MTTRVDTPLAAHYRLMRTMTLIEKIDYRSEAQPNGCVEWTGARSHGYGSIRHGGRSLIVSRAVWEHHQGPVPDGFDVLHRCDNPPCRNLAHLFLGTNEDNIADRVSKGRASGPAHGHVPQKLTWADVESIRTRASAGELHRVIAADHALSRSMVSQIVRGEHWDPQRAVRP